MSELAPSTSRQIEVFAAEGDELARRGQYADAIRRYNDAWQLLPSPQNEWAESTWLLVALGDAGFRGGFFTTGVEALGYAVHCLNGLGNPFIHLRLGQCELELGNLAVATDNLLRAYALEGKDIFREEDSKYFEHLRANVSPPASGVW